ncbi:MAG: hypothetical protein E2O39_14495 [Planctomycetota bacterium]|nr:MAG: hypothetical protein E2O39_14495 [Planctomycetota bacterium]
MNTTRAPRSDPELAALVARELERAPSPAARALADEILRRHGGACRAILYYGSGLRAGDEGDVVLDLLVVVDAYRGFYTRRGHALLNAVLAPNVFYLETTLGERTVRAKYAVVSGAHLARGTSPRTLQVYWWGRFSQPCLLVHARDAAARSAVTLALAQAVATFIARAIPLVPNEFHAAELWQTGLAACYATELRAERPGNARGLVELTGRRSENITRAALVHSRELSLPIGDMRVSDEPAGARFHSSVTPAERRRSRFIWAVRRVHGKALHLLRLVKSAFTFEGGVDYLLWKIERHSGVRVEPSARVRRHPLIFGWATLWKLRRLGAFR